MSNLSDFCLTEHQCTILVCLIYRIFPSVFCLNLCLDMTCISDRTAGSISASDVHVESLWKAYSFMSAFLYNCGEKIAQIV